MRPFFSDPTPYAVAHRGSRLLWPENTMEAFQGAVDLGYRYLETDLHRSSDGVLMVFHDDTLDRTTNGSGAVSSRTAAELGELDAAYQFAPHEGYPRRGTGVGIPTLGDVFDAFPSIRLVLDLKEPGFEADLAAFLGSRGLEDQVIVGAFSDARLARFRKASEGRVATSSGPAETLALWTAARFGRTLKTKADALQIPEDFAFVALPDRKLVQAAAASGRQVHVWTVNDPDHMARLLDIGVHALITDRPDLLKQLMVARGEWK
ncbi:MAG: glycerophosphodiester phosphodiesterase [Acidimicrobiia bacterium]|nr:glycerophosphodiester phosphodiesterase [Acidimicrobiia bacterium]MBT8193727.1 glycerophosphodiester phosphodiesterase [Acidimicrobiia bacterium]NNF87425.1 glycerophosphodiester phosphodiesterase [Acidimicrobiia bacterium]NNJ48276.1 glycerophosphodiester phosphodiesterase [Acidimicrobiia bacterium]NNL14684.1 glycerophosphodiester phosphodiesterase [Acidimicrobiia bacterium]